MCVCYVTTVCLLRYYCMCVCYVTNLCVYVTLLLYVCMLRYYCMCMLRYCCMCVCYVTTVCVYVTLLLYVCISTSAWGPQSVGSARDSNSGLLHQNKIIFLVSFPSSHASTRILPEMKEDMFLLHHFQQRHYISCK
jgi:hypothetical protein